MWSLHSKARWIDLDRGLESPCLAKPSINVFPMKEYHSHKFCMNHCKKLGGKSPSLSTKQNWKDLWQEIKAVSPDLSKLPYSNWLSITEGYDDNDDELKKLDHWPKEIQAMEGMWRDFYTGEQLENFTKPWKSNNRDEVVGDAYNCVSFSPNVKEAETKSWTEWQCKRAGLGCPCTYETPPLIHLRGYCPGTLVPHSRYAVTQLASDPSNIIMIDLRGARIEYNSSLSQWILSDPSSNVTATLRASRNSHALGKHNWTITGDKHQCYKGKEYSIEMKLTGCDDKTQFTCDDGQCVKMEERCNQMPDCEDKSDELNCRILVLERGFNKRVPPVGTTSGEVRMLDPVEVRISLTLYKIVAIKEEEHSIQLQFQISLEWKENRATYYNLKPEFYLNALSMDEINSLWLPLIVYMNTDQQLTTRLGWVNEWTTEVNVKREGNFTQSSSEVLDETHLYRGDENTLIMTQSYTHDFQCVYQLERYPFDTQVG